MNRKFTQLKLLRYSIAAISGTLVSGMMSAPVFAADPTIEEVIVTGTRKEGLSPTETLSPVDVIGGGSITNQAAFDMTDSLSKLTPSLNTQRFPIADGTAFIRPVTLRNLSPDQTLVLVNGTRRHRSALVNLQLAPLGTINQGSQAVDFSAIPSAAIKRVEVLRDGASAQYGSDAIAGVINVILNDASEGVTLSTQYGEYSEGDGERFTISGNAGLPLGEEGFLNLTVEHSTSDITSRGNPRPDAAAVAAIVGAENVAYNGFGQRWGDPDIEATKFFANFGMDLTNDIELYGNTSYMDKETISGFFYRGPVLDPIHMTAARATLQTDTDGDFLPDPAPASLVNQIIADGLNPDDYLMPDAGSASGYVLRNPIYTEFPGGYSPLFGADITDYAVVLGIRGENDNGFSWDIRGRIAENELEYVLNQSINPSLGRLSPTSFNPGTLTQEESSFNADFVKSFDNSPLNIGFGFEWRNETYVIDTGDAASTAVGPTAAQFGVGSDGFQGFAPESAGEFESDSYAAYIDIETDITDQLSAAVALRYEDYEEFGDTLDWKISGRYDFSETFAIRGTVNTGFRAPTPGQVNTLNVTTTADVNGNLIPSGTYPVNSIIAQTLGATDLETEESTSFTLGLIFQPFDNTSVTLDYYDITVEDRIGLLPKTISAADVAALTAAGVPNANLLLNSNANFFNNGFDSDISGVDLAVSSDFELGAGNLNMDLRHSYNKQEVEDIKAGTIDAGRAYDLENQVPNHRTVLTFNYTTEMFDALVRFNRYGDWDTTGGLFGPGDASDATSYDGATLVDIEATLRLNETFSVTVGGENVFDELPDDEENGVLQVLGVEDAVTSPWGFNGAFWYVRARAQF